MKLESRLQGRSLRARVFLLTVTGMFSLLLVLGISDFYSLEQSTKQIFQERILLADTLCSGVEASLRQNLMLLQNLSFAANANNGMADTDALRRALHSVRLVSIFSSVFLLDANGKLILMEPFESPSTTAAQMDDLLPVKQALGGKLVVSNLLRRRGKNKHTMLFLVPLPAGGTVAIAGGEIDPGVHALAKSFAGLNAGSSTYLEILDGNGYVLASSRAEHLLKESIPVLGAEPEIKTEAGSIYISRRTGSVHENGSNKVVAAIPFETIPWTLHLVQDESEALAPALGMRKRFIVLSAILLLIAVPVAWGVSDSVISPVNALTVAARKISDGEFDQPIPVGGGEEIGRLGQTLDQMRQRLKSLLEEIEAANRALEFRVEQRTSEVRRLYEELKQKEEVRKILLHKIISAQEAERKRISRELHDDFSQVIAALLLALTSAEETPQSLNVRYLRDLAVRAMDSVHRMILDLRPPVLDDLGLFSAIRSYAEERLKPLGIEVFCAGNLSDSRLDSETEIELFRIAQESITNIARHANAENVMITLEQREGTLALEVEDDGSGFDPSQIGAPTANSVRGMGLLSMKERVQLLEGSFSIRSTPDSGTLLSVIVPLRNREVLSHG